MLGIKLKMISNIFLFPETEGSGARLAHQKTCICFRRRRRESFVLRAGVTSLVFASSVKTLLSVLVERTRGDASWSQDENEEHWTVCLFLFVFLKSQHCALASFWHCRFSSYCCYTSTVEAYMHYNEETAGCEVHRLSFFLYVLTSVVSWFQIHCGGAQRQRAELALLKKPTGLIVYSAALPKVLKQDGVLRTGSEVVEDTNSLSGFW